MRQGFEAQGLPVAVLGINAMDAADAGYQAGLAANCRFPLFQDVPEVGSWALHGAEKDDFLVYDASGRLVAYLPVAGSVSTNLAHEEGFQNVRNAVLGALPR